MNSWQATGTITHSSGLKMNFGEKTTAKSYLTYLLSSFLGLFCKSRKRKGVEKPAEWLKNYSETKKEPQTTKV